MRIKLFALFVLSLTSAIVIVHFDKEKIQEQALNIPNDWFMAQRLFPQDEINFEHYKKSVKQSQRMRLQKTSSQNNWELAGPTNIGGRISDVELISTNSEIIYAGVASGGVFKSTDGGVSWFPIFDDAVSLSIGDIAIDPKNSETIYVGTGEINAGGGSITYGGAGIYKSTNGGNTWENIDLENTRYISRIVIDPKNPQNIFVGAMGKLFNTNDERGVYRSKDGGQTWEKVLFISDKTGCADLVINHKSPNYVYAAMWERIRTPKSRAYGGRNCGIYRSDDGGTTWTELTNGIPNSIEDIGRIGIAISNSNPDILYSIYADKIGFFDGVFKTTDKGDTWTRTNDASLVNLYANFGWWFGNIRIDPNDPNTVFVLGLDIYKTTNSGQSWNFSSSGVHVDQHAMYITPANSNHIIAGNDGGIYQSINGGSAWSKAKNLPITQFYTCEIDYQNPERLYGGTQDNSTMRTMTGSLDDWQIITGGDGFYVLVDPNDNNYIYAEFQWGNILRSIDGGSFFTRATSGIPYDDRKNWNTPIVFDPNNSSILFTGTHRVYKSTDRAVSWFPISEDLTSVEVTGNIPFATITTIAVAPSNSETIYVGTDDGNVWITKNGGVKWIKISQSLPLRWITRVAVSPSDDQTAYVTLSGYRQDVYLPHIFRTTDGGQNWTDISSNLPESPVNDVIIDELNESTLYVATDVGVFTTDNLGQNWNHLASGLPNVAVTDIDFHNPTRTLVAATYGRSMYKIDLSSITNVDAASQELPNSYQLHQNYPNPFNPSTKISFAIPSLETHHGVSVQLKIFDILGNEITTLVNEQKAPGIYEVEFNTVNVNGQTLSSGIYIYTLQAGNISLTKKMMLLK